MDSKVRCAIVCGLVLFCRNDVSAEEVTCVKEDFSDGSLGIFSEESTNEKFIIKKYSDFPEIIKPDKTNEYFFSTNDLTQSLSSTSEMDLKKDTEVIFSLFTSNTGTQLTCVFNILDSNGNSQGLKAIMVNDSKKWRNEKHKVAKDLEKVKFRLQCGPISPATAQFAMDHIGIKAPDAPDCISDIVPTTTTLQSTTIESTTSILTTTASTTSPPTTLISTTLKPTTLESTSLISTTLESTTFTSTTLPPTTSTSTTLTSTSFKPTTSVSTTLKSTTLESTTFTSTTLPLTTSPSTTLTSTTLKSTTAVPTTSKSTTSELTTLKPTTSAPTTFSPTTSKPTTSVPTNPVPTTLNPIPPVPTTNTSPGNTPNPAPPSGLELWEILSIAALVVAVLSLSFTAGATLYFFINKRSTRTTQEVMPTAKSNDSVSNILPRLEIKKGISHDGQTIIDITGKKVI